MYQFEPDHYPRKDSDSAIADRRVNDLTAGLIQRDALPAGTATMLDFGAGDKPHKFTGNGG
jgi:uncharacterized protein YijF (DUF1287 family)